MSLAFENIALSLIMLIIIYTGINAAMNKIKYTIEQKKKVLRQTTIIGLIYFTYLFILSYFEILFEFGLPPRFPIFLLLPVIFLNGLFGYKCSESKLTKTFPIHWLILLQSFRILVEIILVEMYLDTIIPIEATLYGINYDILVGISALPLAYFVWKNKISKKLLIIWNVWGILMVILVAFTIATSIYFPERWGYTEVPVNTSFLAMPLMLLPTFLAPLAIFTHVVTLIRLKNEE